MTIEEYGWAQVGESRHSFARTGELTRACRVVHDRGSGVSVVAGIEDLTVLNTTNSEFWGFPRDEYTTLEETRDRMLATQVSAWWRYRGPRVERGPGLRGVDWDAAFEIAREATLSAFSETYSYSLQQTLYAIGERIIEAVPDVCEVRLALPNKHHYLVDLAPFGLPNDNEVYHAGGPALRPDRGHRPGRRRPRRRPRLDLTRCAGSFRALQVTLASPRY